MSNIRKVKLFINQKEKSQGVAIKVREALKRNGFEESEEDFDLGIAIGGDGTFLRMIKQSNFRSDVFFVGINAGALGFAQEVRVEEIDSFMDSLKEENFFYEEIGVGKGIVKTNEKEEEFHFLNEVAIRDEELNVNEMNISINNVLLEEFAGDGLLIATSFGSTAYNLSYGGSMVYNTFHTLQITPIAPINNKIHRSLRNSVIIPFHNTITLDIMSNPNLILMIDGNNMNYYNVEKIILTGKEEPIKVIRQQNYNFIQKVNEKFLK